MGDVCEMIHVSPGFDGMGEERPCTEPAIGTTENGTRVCRECGAGMEEEKFRVDWDDAAPAPRVQVLAREYASGHGRWMDLGGLWSILDRVVGEAIDDLHERIKKLGYAWADQLFAEAHERWLGSKESR